MTSQAQALLQASKKSQSQILNVGDFVTATIDNGSSFVSCYVYEIHSDYITFLWNAVTFSVEIELASLTTGLIRAFDREAVIAEILSMINAA